MVEPRRPYMGPRRPPGTGRLTNDPNGVENATPNLNSNDPGRPVAPTARRGYGSRPRQQFPGKRDNVSETPNPEISHTEHHKHEKNERNDSFLEAIIKLIHSILRLKGK